MHPIAIVILAAGNSSRLGQNKQLVTINEQALIAHQCQKMIALDIPIYCVLGYQANAITQVLGIFPQVNIIENKNWPEGLASSIVTAVKTLKQQYKNLLFVLSDQWQLTTNGLLSFIKAADLNQPNILAAALHAHTKEINLIELSPPVIFHQNYYPQLLSLQGKEGAKTVLRTNLQHTIPIHLPEAFVDLDTPEQLSALRAIYPK